MPHTGVEPKPAWQNVPREVRLAACTALGVPVQRATRAWGGYTPAPTYRLRLADGRRAFFKAVGPHDGASVRASFIREQRVYHELYEIITPWAPELYASFECDGWRVLLLEDLGPKSVPPWTPAATRAIFHACAGFHQAMQGLSLPAWLPRSQLQLFAERFWDDAADSDSLQPVVALAGERAEAAVRWLQTAAPVLSHACRESLGIDSPSLFIHGDLRSDNLRWRQGRLRLFDWPHVGVGAPEYDAAAFAQSVTVEGGPEPEQIMAWYAERMPVRAQVLDASVAALAAYFADRGWQPELPGLPRVRAFQRAQLRVTLAWAARRLGLPGPSWLSDVRA